MTDTDPGLEADLPALLKGRLDPARAHAITDYLSRRPDRAAALFADMRDTAELRLALCSPGDPASPRLVAAARRLQGRLRGQRLMRRAAPIAAAVVLFAAGWAGHALWQSPRETGAPPLVEAALDAQAALELRHWMTSQPESLDLDTQEIVAALGIDLPALPKEWILRDVQIVATPQRPGVAIIADAPELGRILLMAVPRNPADTAPPPTAFEYRGRTVALFERGRSAFVLVDSSGHPEQLATGVSQFLDGSK